MTRLVLVHGRDQQGRDPDAVEREWLAALRAGLAAAGRPLDVRDDDARFVFYGDTLGALVDGRPAPPVTVHAVPVHAVPGHGVPDGPGVAALAALALTDDDVRAVLAVVRDVLGAALAAPPRAAADAPSDDGARGAATARGVAGPQSGPQADPQGVLDALLAGITDSGLLVPALAALDRLVPAVGGLAIAVLARDVHRYLTDPAVRDVVDAGLADALDATPGEPAVVVAHSFGAVVAYAVLRGRARQDADVPLLLTLGGPLGIGAVRDALRRRAPLAVPAPVRRWVDARDPRDVVALEALTPDRFPVPPGGRRPEPLLVDNPLPGHHGVVGYLGAAPVGRVLAGPVADVLGSRAGPAPAT